MLRRLYFYPVVVGPLGCMVILMISISVGKAVLEKRENFELNHRRLHRLPRGP